MYYMLIEIAGYRQLLRVNRDGLVRLVRDICSALEYSGGTVHLEENGTLYAEFRSSSSFDLGRIIHGVYKAYELLQDSRQELHGFSMVMEHLRGAERTEAHRRMNVLLQNAAVESCFWIGANASADVTPFLKLQRKLDMWRVEGLQDRAVVLPDFAGFIRDSDLIEPLCQQIRTFLDDADQTPSDTPDVALVHGVPGSGVFAVVRELATCLSGTQQQLPVPECIAVSTNDSDWNAFQSLGRHAFYGEVRDHLSSYEAEIWDRVRWALSFPYDHNPGAVHADSLIEETEHALSLFLKAYVSSCSKESSPAVLVLQRVEHFSADYLSLIRRALHAVPGSGRLLVLASSRTPHIPASLRQFRSIKVATRALDPAAISEFLGNLPPHLHRDASSRVRILTRGRALHLFQYLWMIERLGEDIEHLEQRDKEMDDVVMSVLGDHEKTALYLASIAMHHSSAHELSNILEGLGVPPTLRNEIWNSLAAAGLVYSAQTPCPTSDGLISRIKQSLGDEASSIRLHLQNELYRLFSIGHISLTKSRYELLLDHPEAEVRLHMFEAYLTHEFYSGRTDILDAVFAGDVELPVMNDDDGSRRRIEQLLYLLRLARYRDFPVSTERGPRNDPGQREISAWTHYFSASVTDRDGKLLLERSRWHAAHGAVSDSSRFARRAAVRFQEHGNDSGASEAQVEIGAAQLAAGNVTEAREYFAMARSTAGESFDIIHKVRSLSLEAVATFLYGNYSYCFELCENAGSVASQAGSRGWELFAEFIRGRAFMELGRYEQATGLFDAGIRRASVYGMNDAQAEFLLWYARASAYNGSPQHCLQTLDTVADSAESRLFAAEALDMLDRPDEALALLESVENVPEPDRVPVTRPNWVSGFSGIEDRVYANKSVVLRQLLRSYTGFLLGRAGNTEKAIQVLRESTRAIRSGDTDPYLPLYYFWYSTVLPRSKVSRYDDPATEIGRSVKIVQQRLSRIEQHADKVDYKSRNIWFGRLFDEARKHNLV